jgi:hypothetical protein
VGYLGRVVEHEERPEIKIYKLNKKCGFRRHVGWTMRPSICSFSGMMSTEISWS